MLKKIKTPFTEEQVKNLNIYQKSGSFHAFTCIGRPYIHKAKPGMMGKLERSRLACPNDGMLKATEDGWVCPCGEHRQNWAYEFMSEPIEK